MQSTIQGSFETASRRHAHFFQDEIALSYVNSTISEVQMEKKSMVFPTPDPFFQDIDSPPYASSECLKLLYRASKRKCNFLSSIYPLRKICVYFLKGMAFCQIWYWNKSYDELSYILWSFRKKIDFHSQTQKTGCRIWTRGRWITGIMTIVNYMLRSELEWKFELGCHRCVDDTHHICWWMAN